MSRLFRSRTATAGTPHYYHHHYHDEGLDPVLIRTICPTPTPQSQEEEQQQEQQQHQRAKSLPSALTAPAPASTPEFQASRPWLSTVESRPSWAERPPPRKLVKEQNSSSSGRPSFSQELSDGSDSDKDKGIVRRNFDRLRNLYRRRGADR